MSARKLKDTLTNLDKAVVNLERALTIPNDREQVVEGTIHRFEITVEVMWTTLKWALEYEGLSPKTPRDSLKDAFRAGWLHDEAEWLDMLDHRNTTSHNDLVENNDRDITKITPTIRSTLDFPNERYETIV